MLSNKRKPIKHVQKSLYDKSENVQTLINYGKLSDVNATYVHIVSEHDEFNNICDDLCLLIDDEEMHKWLEQCSIYISNVKDTVHNWLQTHPLPIPRSRYNSGSSHSSKSSMRSGSSHGSVLSARLK